jgi:hypothetical protein
MRSGDRGRLRMAWSVCGGAGVLAAVAGCFPFPPGGIGVIELSFDFREGLDDWSADIADYPVVNEDDLEFSWGADDLPAELGIDGAGLRVESFNRPDDVFTFIKRRLGPLDGIVAGQTYRVAYEILVASSAPSGCAGVGGAPGESVYLKAGASAIEPEPVLNDEGTDVGLSVDVGEQANGGPAASIAGHMANGVPCELIPDLENAPYVLLLRTHEHETTVTAGDAGELWALVGTDSGFESRTRLYYVRVSVTLTPVLLP